MIIQLEVLSMKSWKQTKLVCWKLLEALPPRLSYNDTHHLFLALGAKYSSTSFLQYEMELSYKCQLIGI